MYEVKSVHCAPLSAVDTLIRKQQKRTRCVAILSHVALWEKVHLGPALNPCVRACTGHVRGFLFSLLVIQATDYALSLNDYLKKPEITQVAE